jgi:uncharacterized protein DUF397
MTSAWRTSSYSSNGSSCVQVHRELAAVRDSKNPDGPVLRADFRSLVTAIHAGRFTR